jgi:hypothetical protein
MEDRMAERTSELLEEGLRRAAAHPLGLPLYTGRAVQGLFGSSALGRSAAQEGMARGLLQVVRTESRGKTPVEFAALTEKGLDHLSRQSCPRQLLEDLVRSLDNRDGQLREQIEWVKRSQLEIAALKRLAERLLEKLAADGAFQAPSVAPDLKTVLLSALEGSPASPAAADCTLSEWFTRARAALPMLTIGAFHDALRDLHARGEIYLHPWTGPLYELPEPAYALLVGHEVLFYASARSVRANGQQTPPPIHEPRGCHVDNVR